MNIDTTKLTSVQLILVNIASLTMMMFLAASMSLWFSWVLNRFKNKGVEPTTSRWTGALATIGLIDVAFAFCCMLFLQFSVVSVYVYQQSKSLQSIAQSDSKIAATSDNSDAAAVPNKNSSKIASAQDHSATKTPNSDIEQQSDEKPIESESTATPPPAPASNAIQIPIEINLIARSMDVISVGLVSLFIVFRTNRTRKWIGWGTEKLGSDIAAGFKYFIMFTPIIIAINALVMSVSGADYNHPIQEMIKKSPWLIAVAFWMACIVAPLTEEFAFRAVLIGWFESIQYGRERFTAAMVGESNPPETPTKPSWIHPILSGALFGLAHFEYGVSWVPLVVFGIILGRMYQLRQSVWTTIVVHALFNFFSLSMMVLSIFIKTA